jgi:hypothetical protein
MAYRAVIGGEAGAFRPGARLFFAAGTERAATFRMAWRGVGKSSLKFLRIRPKTCV